MGFIKSRPGNLQGYTFGLPAVVNVNDDEDAMATVAHEFGHTGPFLLGDEYNGGSFNCDNNPTPPNYVGKNFSNGAQVNFSCTASTEVPYDTNGRAGTGSTIPPSAHAFDMTRGLLTSETLSFMGSGSPMAEVWVTPRAYERAFDQATPFAATSHGPPGPVVQLWGWFRTDPTAPAGVAFDLEPWETYTGEVPDAPATLSEYTVRAYDAANVELLAANLAVDFYGRDPVRLLPEVPIDGAIGFPSAAVRFDVMKGTQVLASVPVSANDPVVTVTAPTGGTVTGTQTITWTGSDADPGTTLTYSVEYCESSAAPCDVIASDLTATQLSADFDQLPGSAAGFVRVIATDGLRTTSAESPTFEVPFKAPEVEVFEPDEGEEFQAGEDITFDAMIFDEQDTTITAKSQLRWSSSVDGDIGTGARIYSSKLTAGSHVVTLTATNSKGQSATASVNVTVTPGTGSQPPPGCGCSAGPGVLWFGLLAAGALLRRRRK
jgi:MYXO-CTERM domain-containing protein